MGLKKHAKAHDGLRCEVCGKRFYKRAKLEQHAWKHMDAVAADGTLTVSAGQGKTISLRRAEKRPLLRSDRKHEIFKCDQCDMQFWWFRELVQHKKAEHPKAHICPDCGRAYRRESALRDHQQRAHAEAVFPCTHEGCMHVFSSGSNLRMHLRTVHQGLRPFTCRQCGQTFAY